MNKLVLSRKVVFIRDNVFVLFRGLINQELNECGWLVGYGSREELLLSLYQQMERWSRISSYYVRGCDKDVVDISVVYRLIKEASVLYNRLSSLGYDVNANRIRYYSEWIVKNERQVYETLKSLSAQKKCV